MKKRYLILIFIFIIVIILKYIFSNYNLEYTINNYNIKTMYKDNRLYFEIVDKDNKYNFDIYSKRKFKKSKIIKIETIDAEDFNCIYPIINNQHSYPLCQKNGVFIDYNLIDSELLLKYKKNNNIDTDKDKDKDFIYYNNLSNSQYVALWNYKGYFIMNGNNYNNVVLFKKDKYDNNLSYLYKDTFYIADYDSEHEFNKLILLNIKTQKKSEMILPYKLDFDSYFVGSIGKYIYLFDNKYSILYELNVKNGEFKIKCNNEIGYVKYNGNDFVSCSRSEYKVNKITYSDNKEKSLYTYNFNNGFYKIINENKNIKQLINDNDIKIIKENKNNIYYSLNNNLYLYDPSIGNKKILYYYELEFNNSNMIYLYLEN